MRIRFTHEFGYIVISPLTKEISDIFDNEQKALSYAANKAIEYNSAHYHHVVKIEYTIHKND